MSSRLGRLRRGPEFDTVYAEGTVYHGPLFVLRARKSGGPGNRWGFAVGKKVAPKAVVRNRARRRMRDAVRAAGVQDAGFDVVFTAKASLLSASFAELRAETERLLERLPQQDRR